MFESFGYCVTSNFEAAISQLLNVRHVSWRINLLTSRLLTTFAALTKKRT